MGHAERSHALLGSIRRAPLDGVPAERKTGRTVSG